MDTADGVTDVIVNAVDAYERITAEIIQLAESQSRVRCRNGSCMDIKIVPHDVRDKSADDSGDKSEGTLYFTITNKRNEKFDSGVSDYMYNEILYGSDDDSDSITDSDNEDYGMVCEVVRKVYTECDNIHGTNSLIKYTDYNHRPIGSVQNKVPMKVIINFIYENGGLVPMSAIKSANKF